MVDYSSYEDSIKNMLNSGDITNFKGSSNYTAILEHTSLDLGVKYLDCIRSYYDLSDDEVIEYCNTNDKIGSPKLESIHGLLVSPSSLRYIFHSLKILEYCRSLGMNDLKFVEVGAGYGGLILALNHFASRYDIKIQEYHCVDLAWPLKLQQKYISYHTLEFNVIPHINYSFGSDIDGSNYFLISNYCFSEIDKSCQDKYITNLFPKISHGFLTWNHIPVYDIGKNVKVELEYPLTCPETHEHKNYYVYF
jgi:hypothetical protein